MDSFIDSLPFSYAKSQLSSLMTSVVHDFSPRVISRHNGKEEIILVNTAMLEAMVADVAFETEVVVGDGEFVVRLPELNLIGGGESFDEAVDELVEVASEFASQYIHRLRYYQESERLARLRPVLKIALTPEADRRDLFCAPPVNHRALVEAL